jgi:hypothetical protein
MAVMPGQLAFDVRVYGPAQLGNGHFTGLIEQGGDVLQPSDAVCAKIQHCHSYSSRLVAMR